MSKGLEALERIIGCSTIESHTKKWQQDYLIVEKELKVLEIIKKKSLYWDIQYQPYEEKNDYRAWDNELYESVKLTKEEYDLLKEVLL